MINAIERQNNTRKSIESTARLVELLDDLQLIKYASFISINRLSDKESSLIARESNRSRESINSQIKQQNNFIFYCRASLFARFLSFKTLVQFNLFFLSHHASPLQRVFRSFILHCRRERLIR